MENSYKNFLMSQLNVMEQAHSKEMISVEETMLHLDLIYEDVPVLEFGQPTGETFRFMPKAAKMMLLKVISPTSSLTSTCVWETSKTGQILLRATAQLYFDRNDQRPVASYTKSYDAARLMDGTNPSNATFEQRSNAEGLARGIVETRCLTAFGFGIWLNDPEEVEPEEKLAAMDGNNDVATIPENIKEAEDPFTSEPLEAQAVSKKETAKEVHVKEVQVEKPETKEPEIEIASMVLDMTLDEAKEVKATVGLAKEKCFTIGQIADECKYTNLRYIYAHSKSDKEKSAIKTIALANPEIIKVFQEGGVEI